MVSQKTVGTPLTFGSFTRDADGFLPDFASVGDLEAQGRGGEVTAEIRGVDDCGDSVVAVFAEGEERGEVDRAANGVTYFDGEGFVRVGTDGSERVAACTFDLHCKPFVASVVGEVEVCAGVVGDGDSGNERFVGEINVAFEADVYAYLCEGCGNEEEHESEEEGGNCLIGAGARLDEATRCVCCF